MPVEVTLVPNALRCFSDVVDASGCNQARKCPPDCWAPATALGVNRRWKGERSKIESSPLYLAVGDDMGLPPSRPF